MASLTDILTTIQNGVTAASAFGKQMQGSLNNISSQLTTLQSSTSGVKSIAGRTGVFTLNGTTGITNTLNDIQLSQGSSSQFGAVKVDGTTITAAAGVLSAVTSTQTITLLNTLTASNSATLSDTTSLTSTYTFYEIVFENIIPATNAQVCELQVHSGGSFQATSYKTTSYGNNSGGVQVPSSPTTFIGCSLSAGNTGNSAPGTSGSIRVYSPSTVALHQWGGQFTGWDGGGTTVMTTGGFWNSSAVIDGFQVLFSSGNITSGVIKVYGYR